MGPARPLRSVIYIPASNARALEKAATLPADAIIFDLEDAVSPDEKMRARDALAVALQADHGPQMRIVRVNALTTPWGADDVRAFAGHLCVDVVLIPKVSHPGDLDHIVELAPGKPLWAMMETALGMLNAAAIAGHPALHGLVMGTNDLARDIGARDRPDRLPLQAGLGLCLLAAKAYGRVIIDGVYNVFKDDDGLRAACEQGRDLGFDGKTLIHPAQIAIANAAFAPSEAEIDLARRQIAAFDAATAAGQGVAVVDGRIVENLHIAMAQTLLVRAQMIAKLAQ